MSESRERVKLMRLNSVEWAQHVALCVERQLRASDAESERRRLCALRDWHFARLTDEQIRRRRP